MPLRKRPKLGFQFRQIREQALPKLVAAAFDEILKTIPVENGHAHEAFCAAHERMQTQDNSIRSVLIRNARYRSNDKRAKARGRGRIRHYQTRSQAEVKVSLPFVATMDTGGTLTTIAPKGKKASPKSKGKLYGKRQAGSRGMLMWMEGGVMKFAKYRKVGPLHFVQNGLNAATDMAASLGFKER